MSNKGYVFVSLVLSILFLLILPGSINSAQSNSLSAEFYVGPPMTESFTYQGYFEYAGNPANGSFDFRITIWDQDILGTEIASCQVLDNIFIKDGLFSFHLIPNISMSLVFNGEGRWLEVAVRQSGTTSWSTLPRQPITAAPYAWSLRPGANIQGTTVDSTLSLINNGNGGALFASSSEPTGKTIAAEHTTDGFALYGSNDGGFPAVAGDNGGDGNGLFGYSEGGHGVVGYTNSSSESAVVGTQIGYEYNDLGTYLNPGGFFGGRNGVVGVTKTSTGYGVLGLSFAENSYAVVGNNTATTGYAGYFSSSGNGVYIYSPVGTTGLTVSGGTKNAAVDTDLGSTLLYTEESTEVWFTDYGFGVLENESMTINIDPLFAQTINVEEPYHVFLQAYGDAVIYVTNRTPTSFDVHLSVGTLPVEFSYRIAAKRLGYENDRLETGKILSPEASEALQKPIIEGDLP